MKLACQEHLLPGATLITKWQFCQTVGFNGIELGGRGDFQFRERLPELRQARAAGVTLASVCVQMDHFIGDFDRERRRDAIEQMKSLLDVVGELGGLGAITQRRTACFRAACRRTNRRAVPPMIVPC